MSSKGSISSEFSDCENKNIHSFKELKCDFEILSKEKEEAERNVAYYKERCFTLQEDIDTLKSLLETSAQNRKKLANIIEEKNNFMKQGKCKESYANLKKELLNSMETLAQEKMHTTELENKINSLKQDLHTCQTEKLTTEKKLKVIIDELETKVNQFTEMLKESENVKSKINERYRKLEDQLNSMIAAQAAIKAQIKDYEAAMEDRNQENETLKKKLTCTEMVLQRQQLEGHHVTNNLHCETSLQHLQEQLTNCRQENESLLQSIQPSKKLELELKDEIEQLKNKNYASQQTIQALHNELHESDSKRVKLVKYLENLEEMLKEYKSLKEAVTIKAKDLEQLQKENTSLQIKINGLVQEKNRDDSLYLELKDDFFKKEKDLQELLENTKKKLQDQLKEARQELHDCIKKQKTLNAENSAILEETGKKILQYKTEITRMQEEKNDIENQMKQLHTNQAHSDAVNDSIKKRLSIITKERDEKINVICTLRKFSNEMQIFAEECKIEQNKLQAENNMMRETAYDAQLQLNICAAERDSLLSEVEAMQVKLIDTERTYNLKINNIKKEENRLKRDLLEVQENWHKSLAAINSANFDRESAQKKVKESEKQLILSSKELGETKVALKKLQTEHNNLQTKLTEYENILQKFTGEIEKLQGEKHKLQSIIENYENNIKELEESKQNKGKNIAMLEDQYKQLYKINTELEAKITEQNIWMQTEERLKSQIKELHTKCQLLEEDVQTLQGDLKSKQRSTRKLKCKNKNLESEIADLRNNNKLLMNQCSELESMTGTLKTINVNLTENYNKLETELHTLKQELMKAKERTAEMEGQNRHLQNCINQLQDKCNFYDENTNMLNQELTNERELRQELYDKIEELKNHEYSVVVDKEKLTLEKNVLHRKITENKSKLDELESSYSELQKKCCYLEEKELLLKEEIDRKNAVNCAKVEECESLEQKRTAITKKLGQYVVQNKKMNMTNISLKNTIKRINEELKKIERENEEVKEKSSKIENAMKEIKIENEKLNDELRCLKDQQLDEKHVGSKLPQARSKGDDPVAELNSLLSRVRKYDTPAAAFIMKTCSNAKALIIKERQNCRREINLPKVCRESGDDHLNKN